eukprot:6209366-Pleurochrysis_carterae.AAC.5
MLIPISSAIPAVLRVSHTRLKPAQLPMLQWLVVGAAVSRLLLPSLLLQPLLQMANKADLLHKIIICAVVGDAVADNEADVGADADADAGGAAAPAAPAPPSASRHAAIHELEFIRLRQRIDMQRNRSNNPEAEITNLNKETVRALQERDHVRQKAAAAAVEKVRLAHESIHVLLSHWYKIH